MADKIIDPGTFLYQKHTENANGKILFSTNAVKKFISTYTHIDYSLLTKTQKLILKGELIRSIDWNQYDQLPKYWDGLPLDFDIWR